MTKHVSRKLLTAWLLVLPALVASAPCPADEVVYASGSSRDDLQTAVDALGGPGVVVVSPGTWEIVGKVLVSWSDVTVIGCGTDRTTIRRSSPPAGWTSSTPGWSDYTAAFVAFEGAERARIAHLAFEGWPASTDDGDRDYGVRFFDAMDFRVDHCSFDRTGGAAVQSASRSQDLVGESRGVVDHCTFTRIYEAPIGNYGYGVLVGGTGAFSGEPFGSPWATFVEDSSFSGCRHAVSSNGGARYVFRYNQVSGSILQAIDAHGAEYPPGDAPDCRSTKYRQILHLGNIRLPLLHASSTHGS